MNHFKCGESYKYDTVLYKLVIEPNCWLDISRTWADLRLRGDLQKPDYGVFCWIPISTKGFQRILRDLHGCHDGLSENAFVFRVKDARPPMCFRMAAIGVKAVLLEL